MSTRDVLFISGAEGAYAVSVNGIYDRTSEMRGGFSLYRKRDEPSVFIEHSDGDWDLMINFGFPFFHFVAAIIEGGRVLEACASRVFYVRNGANIDEFDKTTTIKIATGEEAERQVRGSCRRARQHELPPLPHFAISVIVNGFV